MNLRKWKEVSRDVAVTIGWAFFFACAMFGAFVLTMGGLYVFFSR